MNDPRIGDARPVPAQPLTVSTVDTTIPTTVQPRRQRWALPAGLAEQDLMRGYAQAVGQ